MESRFNNQWKSNIRWKNSPIPRLGSNSMEKLGIATPTFFKEFHLKNNSSKFHFLKFNL